MPHSIRMSGGPGRASGEYSEHPEAPAPKKGKVSWVDEFLDEAFPEGEDNAQPGEFSVRLVSTPEDGCRFEVWLVGAKRSAEIKFDSLR